MIERITLKFGLEIFDIAVLLRAVGAVSNHFSNRPPGKSAAAVVCSSLVVCSAPIPVQGTRP
jgi:hypothetical protein